MACCLQGCGFARSSLSMSEIDSLVFGSNPTAFGHAQGGWIFDRTLDPGLLDGIRSRSYDILATSR